MNEHGTPPSARPARAGRWRGWGIALVALLLAALVVWWWHGRSAAGGGHGGAGTWGGSRGAQQGAARVQPVAVGAVQRRDLGVIVTAIGSIAANNTAVVHTKVSGEMKAIYFREGQPVKAGQVLALVDPQPFQIALAQAQAALVRDQAQWRNAQLDLRRYQDLVAKDAAPRQQLDTQDALVQQLKGTVQADQAAVDSARLNLSYTKVVAPIAGLAGLKQADLGNVVNPGDTNGLLSIAQTQPAAVVFAIPESQLPRVRERLQAGQALGVEAWDREQKHLLAAGQVASTDNAIDATTGTVKVKALFPNADNRLFPDQFVNVRLRVDTLAQALVVPVAAVQRGAQGAYVYALQGDGTVALKTVAVQATEGDWSAVQADLQPGQKLVVDGADRLRDGAQVEVIDPAAAASAAAGGASGGMHRHRGQAASGAGWAASGSR